MPEYPALQDLWKRKVPSDYPDAKCPKCQGEDIVFLREAGNEVWWYCHNCKGDVGSISLAIHKDLLSAKIVREQKEKTWDDKLKDDYQEMVSKLPKNSHIVCFDDNVSSKQLFGWRDDEYGPDWIIVLPPKCDVETVMCDDGIVSSEYKVYLVSKHL